MTQENDRHCIRIGGASGYWGESDIGLKQLLRVEDIDYLVFDFLAEITMSILARARDNDPETGYAIDFVTDLIRPNIQAIATSRVRILANAGGVNPLACAEALRKIIADEGLDLKVATVTGDDLRARAGTFAGVREMFSGEAFPEASSIASINAYLGAFPIAEALSAGADIVITGRCVDSALTLAAGIHEFGWTRTDWDLLAAGSLAGHLLECGPQATGGNFTDWQDIADTLVDAGYPIASLQRDGSMVISRPAGTGGCVTVGTVAEQLVYEIGDPCAYILPDVICDFSQVEIRQLTKETVSVTGACGRPAPETFKVSATFSDGWKISTLWYFIGENALAKAESFSEAMLTRTQRRLDQHNLGRFTEIMIESMGAESHYGAFSRGSESREIALKIAAKHPVPKALTFLLKEGSGLALAAPPGLALFSGGRPKPSPVVRLFSFLISKTDLPISVELNGNETGFVETPIIQPDIPPPVHTFPSPSGEDTVRVRVLLREIAFGRSGDKGNKANIGIIPRDPAYIPYICEQVTTDAVAERFAHFLKGNVERFFMPGTGAVNYLLHDVLAGGGTASLRNDPQGKSYAQILLDMPVYIPRSLYQEAPNASL